jgi:hypothetical protein
MRLHSIRRVQGLEFAHIMGGCLVHTDWKLQPLQHRFGILAAGLKVIQQPAPC